MNSTERKDTNAADVEARSLLRPPAMTVKDLFMVLFRRKGLILITLAVASGGTLIGSYLLSPRYRSEASFLVQRDRPPSLSQLSSVNWTVDRDEVIQTEVAILRSRSVIGQTVDQIGLENLPEPPQFSGLVRRAFAALGLIYDLPARERWIRWIDRHLDIRPVVQANVITVGLRGEDPQLIADILKKLSDAYLDKHADAYRNEGAYRFYEEQVQLSREALEQLKAEEESTKNSLAVSSFDEQRSLSAVEKKDLEQDIREASRARAEFLAAAESLRAGDSDASKFVSVAVSESFPAIERMQDRLVELESERIDLVQKYRAGDPKIASLLAEIRGMRETLAQGLEAASSELASRTRILGRQRDNLNAAFMEFNRKERMLRQLSLATEAAEDRYKRYLERLEDSRLNASQIRQVVNVSIIDEAGVPTQPERTRLFYTGLAALLSLVLGLGLSLMAEFLDPGIYSPGQAQRRLGLPVLAVVPFISRGQSAEPAG